MGMAGKAIGKERELRSNKGREIKGKGGKK